MITKFSTSGLHHVFQTLRVLFANRRLGFLLIYVLALHFFLNSPFHAMSANRRLGFLLIYVLALHLILNSLFIPLNTKSRHDYTRINVMLSEDFQSRFPTHPAPFLQFFLQFF